MDKNAPPLVGTRIRQKRIETGMKQATLAKCADVSASYLNLIEHNRRRIGGKLLNEIAAALGTDPELLSDGAESSALQGLQTAVTDLVDQCQLEPINEFAERFPGWSSAIIAQSNRIANLERTVAGLSDRLAHDPHLAESLHEMISTVTAIQSSASILTATPDIEPQWQGRFQRNILEESERLVEGSRKLTEFLAADPKRDDVLLAPREEFDAFLTEADHRFSEIDAGNIEPEDLISQSEILRSSAAQDLARHFLATYQVDGQKIDEAALAEALDNFGVDPIRIAQHFSAPVSMVLRRLVVFESLLGADSKLGFATCDGSGALTYSRSIEGFGIPRNGSACPLWPLYLALSRPNQPIRQFIQLPGTTQYRFIAYAICETTFPEGMDGPSVSKATMLVIPTRTVVADEVKLGTTCIVCPRMPCPARREPSILASGL